MCGIALHSCSRLCLRSSHFDELYSHNSNQDKLYPKIFSFLGLYTHLKLKIFPKIGPDIVIHDFTIQSFNYFTQKAIKCKRVVKVQFKIIKPLYQNHDQSHGKLTIIDS